MRPEDKILLAATRQNFPPEYQQAVLALSQRSHIDWPALFLTAVNHGVEPLVYYNLKQISPAKLGVPPAVIDKFKQHMTHNVFVKDHMAELLPDILSLFDRYQVEVMLAKGAALDRLIYARPWSTTSEDIDLLLKPTRSELEQIDGGAIITALKAINTQADRLKLHIEYDCYAHHDLNMNGVLPIDFDRIWRDASAFNIGEHRVAIMAPEDLLIGACVNCCRKRFFRLKALCDIAEIISRLPALNWPLFIEKANSYQCDNIVYAALIVTRATIGCDVPSIVLSELKTSRVRKFFIRMTVRSLKRVCSLDTLSRYSGRKIFRRVFGLSLVLPYVTYRWDQVGRKAQELDRAWKQLAIGDEDGPNGSDRSQEIK